MLPSCACTALLAGKSLAPKGVNASRGKTMHRSLTLSILIAVVFASRAALTQHDHAAPQHDHGTSHDSHAEHQATETMSETGRHHGDPHVKLTRPRPLAPEDKRRADAILTGLKSGLERYKDYRAAIEDGYQPFLPQLPLREYHFTNYRMAFREAFRFDASRPSSLLYRKRGDGYELAGAMFTAPKSFTEEQLHERVPLSVATWHAHVNICLPPRGAERPDWSRFGLKGAIVTEAVCRDARGRWYPQLFGWMVHVYPFEEEAGHIWAH